MNGLESLFSEGFSELRMADIATKMGCSLRLLYDLAESRDEMIATIVNRSLWRIGSKASDSVSNIDDPVEAIIVYLRVANRAVAQMSPEFAQDLWASKATKAVALEHEDYLIGRTRSLIEDSIRAGHLQPTDAPSLAIVLAGMGRLLGDSDLANRLTAQILGGLRQV